jgi:predicted ATPase
MASCAPIVNRRNRHRVACLLESIRMKNILSFKDAKPPLDSLSVLIGPNAAGKSNLIDVIGLLQAAPGDLNGAILRGGGAPAWIRKGENGAPTVAGIECELSLASRPVLASGVARTRGDANRLKFAPYSSAACGF